MKQAINVRNHGLRSRTRRARTRSANEELGQLVDDRVDVVSKRAGGAGVVEVWAFDRGPLGSLVPKYLNMRGISAFFELY